MSFFSPYIFTTALATVIVFICCLILRHAAKLFDFFVKREIHGPHPAFPMGTWNHYARKFIGSQDVINTSKFGSFVGTFDGLTPNLLITDKELIQRILTTDRAKFRSRRAERAKNSTLKRVLQILDEEQPQEIGAILGNTSKILDKLLSKIEVAAKGLVSALAENTEDKTENKTKSANNAADEFIDNATAMAILGLDLNEDPIFRQRYVKYSRNIRAGSTSTSPLAALPFLYGGSENSTFCVSTLEYLRSIIITRINDVMNNEDAHKGDSMIDLLVTIAKEEKKTALKEKAQENSSDEKVEESLALSTDVLADVTLATILALLHYSKSTLIFSLYALATDQTISQKLASEIRKSLDQDEAEKNLTVNQLKKLQYLNAFVKEVNRKYPNEFRLEKISESELDLTKEIKLPAETTVTIPIYALHTGAKFHNDAQLFSPERFLDDAYEKLNPVFLSPLGWALPRVISDITTKVAVIKVISALDLEAKPTEEIVYAEGLTGLPVPREIDLLVSNKA